MTGVTDLESATHLLRSTVERLGPAYRGPYDAQALIQYLEALVLQAQRKTAERCVVIASTGETTPDGWRERFGSEIVHLIDREFFHEAM